MKKLIISVKNPFKVITENKSDFFIWFLFTILTGQFGILANFIVRYYTNGTTLWSSIFIESESGSFYTFSIALVASLLGPIFINFIKSKKIEFRTLKTYTIIIAVFYLFITATIYASIQSTIKSNIPKRNLHIDLTQTIIYIFAIIFATYGYCIQNLELSKINFDNINDSDYNKQSDENVTSILNAETILKKDSNGISL